MTGPSGHRYAEERFARLSPHDRQGKITIARSTAPPDENPSLPRGSRPSPETKNARNIMKTVMLSDYWWPLVGGDEAGGGHPDRTPGIACREFGQPAQWACSGGHRAGFWNRGHRFATVRNRDGSPELIDPAKKLVAHGKGSGGDPLRLTKARKRRFRAPLSSQSGFCHGLIGVREALSEGGIVPDLRPGGCRHVGQAPSATHAGNLQGLQDQGLAAPCDFTTSTEPDGMNRSR